jgi:hypothetical protein
VHFVGLRQTGFGWLNRQQRCIFPGKFEPVGWAGWSVGSQYVVEHEDDAHRVAPREDSSQPANEKSYQETTMEKKVN